MITRRAFFSAAALASLCGVAQSAGRRVSCVTGDPGERLYCEIVAQGKGIEVYLDGMLQRDAKTADEALGLVFRHAYASNGRPLYNRVSGEWIYETVYGDVEIRVV